MNKLDRLKRFAKLKDNTPLTTSQELNRVDDELDSLKETDNKLAESISIINEKVEAKQEKGDKGDKGDTGEKGLDGKDGKDGIDGRDGKNGLNGLDGKDGTDGLDGKDGNDGKDGKDGSPDTPDQVIEKIHTSKKLIKREKIEGLDDIDNKIQMLANRPPVVQGVGGGASGIRDIRAGANISVSKLNEIYTIGLNYTPTDTDEKVKYDVNDPTAGYLADKIVAGTGITLTEGTGADENKLKITNSLDLSGYLTLDQTTKQTLTRSPIFADAANFRIPFFTSDNSLVSSANLTFSSNTINTPSIKCASGTTNYAGITGNVISVIRNPSTTLISMYDKDTGSAGVGYLYLRNVTDGTQLALQGSGFIDHLSQESLIGWTGSVLRLRGAMHIAGQDSNVWVGQTATDSTGAKMQIKGAEFTVYDTYTCGASDDNGTAMGYGGNFLNEALGFTVYGYRTITIDGSPVTFYSSGLALSVSDYSDTNFSAELAWTAGTNAEGYIVQSDRGYYKDVGLVNSLSVGDNTWSGWTAGTATVTPTSPYQDPIGTDNHPASSHLGGIVVLPQTQPTSPQTGLVYFDTSDNHPYIYNGTAWKALDVQTPDLSGYVIKDQSTPQTLTASPIFNNLTATRILFASATKTVADSDYLKFTSATGVLSSHLLRIGGTTTTAGVDLDIDRAGSNAVFRIKGNSAGGFAATLNQNDISSYYYQIMRGTTATGTLFDYSQSNMCQYYSISASGVMPMGIGPYGNDDLVLGNNNTKRLVLSGANHDFFPGSTTYPASALRIAPNAARSTAIYHTQYSTASPYIRFFDYGIMSIDVPTVVAAPSYLAFNVTGTDWSSHGIYFGAMTTHAKDYMEFSIGGAGASSLDSLLFTSQNYATSNYAPRSSSGNPLVQIYSGISPATRTTDWMSFQHDQKDGIIETGAGSVRSNSNLIVLDRSVVGAEKITNGSFTGSATGWTITGTGWAYGTNNATKNADGTGTISQTSAGMVTPLVVGEWYELSLDISAFNSSASSSPAYIDKLTVTIGGYTQVITNGTAASEAFTARFQFKATTTDDLVFTGTNLSRVVIDNVSLKKITGGNLEVNGDTTHTGAMKVRTVSDAGPMTATAGTVAEIVFNSSDSKFYGCTVTGSPATWVAFN